MSSDAFNNTTTAQEVANAFKDRIQGKNVLITGTNPRGLGAATARAIAMANPALLILTYRTKAKADQVVAELSQSFPLVKLQTLELDLESPDSIRKAAQELNASISHLDVLINNAGIMSVQERTLTAQGIEVQFATNHLGHFLFTNLILEKLKAAAQNSPDGATRVVNVSGGWHQFGPVRFSDLNFEGKPMPEEEKPDKDYLAKFGHSTENLYIPEVAYAQSKTANILFSVYLTEHLSKHGIISFALNPGGILTEIARHLPQETLDRLVSLDVVDKTEEQGAATTVSAAFDPSLTANSEPYLHDCHAIPPKNFAKDPKLAERLWHLSEDLVGQKFELGS